MSPHVYRLLMNKRLTELRSRSRSSRPGPHLSRRWLLVRRIADPSQRGRPRRPPGTERNEMSAT